MKAYVKPELSIIELRAEEGIACFGSSENHIDRGHGRGRDGQHGGAGRNHGKRPGDGWGWILPW
jgi:hypothetical protein